MSLDQKFRLHCVPPKALLLLDSVCEDGEMGSNRIFQLGPSSPLNTALRNRVSQLTASECRTTVENVENRDCPSDVLQSGAVLDVKRARSGPTDPVKTTELRKKGVCFRCKVLKPATGCSPELPCPPCDPSPGAKKGRRRKHPWMQCVAFASGDVNIFEIQLPCAKEEYIKITQSSDRILTQKLELAFDECAIDDISVVAQEFASLLSSRPEGTMSATRLSVLASSRFQQLVSPLVEDDLSKYTRLLIELSLVLRSGNQVSQYAGYSIEELQHLQSFAGTRAIHGLQTALRIPIDKKSSVDRGQALFLTLFGIIAAVANYCPQPSNPQMLGFSNAAASAHVDMQSQLLRILSHHMIYIADTLELLPVNAPRLQIAQDPATGLGKLLCFHWIEDQSMHSTPYNPAYQSTDTEEGDSPAGPRQAVFMSNDDKLLPDEQCQRCKNMKRSIALHNGECSECQFGSFSLNQSSHFAFINNIMDRDDQASYPGDEAHGPSQVTAIPFAQRCVWCDSISGSDGLCIIHKSADDPFYAVENTNIPQQLWSELLATTGSHLE